MVRVRAVGSLQMLEIVYARGDARHLISMVHPGEELREANVRHVLDCIRGIEEEAEWQKERQPND